MREITKLEETKKAYKEILSVINKHKDIIAYDYNNLNNDSKNHLFGIELKEKYGLDINPLDVNSLSYINLGDSKCVGWWGEKYGRHISWSDDGKQPEDELLLVISFPTGAYIFGDDYPTEFFKEFFQELKTYNPKYTDTTNKTLYFSMDNAGKIFNKFPEILKKYYEKNNKCAKERKIERLKEELKELKK